MYATKRDNDDKSSANAVNDIFIKNGAPSFCEFGVGNAEERVVQSQCNASAMASGNLSSPAPGIQFGGTFCHIMQSNALTKRARYNDTCVLTEEHGTRDDKFRHSTGFVQWQRIRNKDSNVVDSDDDVGFGLRAGHTLNNGELEQEGEEDEVSPAGITCATDAINERTNVVNTTNDREDADYTEEVEHTPAMTVRVVHVHHEQTADELRDFLLLCASDSSSLVRVSRNLLSDYGMMWARLAEHQAPKITECGCRFWTVDCTHACLLCVVQSLRAGCLHLRYDVTMQEVLAEFAYAGMQPPTLRRRNGEPGRRLLVAPEMLLGPGSSAEFRSTALRASCEAIANAVCCWPRLQEVVNSAVSGEWPSKAANCSTSSAWICFVASPVPPTRPCHRPRPGAPLGPCMTVRLWESLADLATRWPAWLQNTLAAMMCIVVDTRARPPEGVDPTIVASTRGIDALTLPATFAHVQEAVQNSQSGEFWTTPYDYAHGTGRSPSRPGNHEVQAMVLAVRTCLTLLLRSTPHPQQSVRPARTLPDLPAGAPTWITAETAHTQWYAWAENFVMLSWSSIKGTCSPKTIFSESCPFGEMRALERQVLADSFAARGIILVEWVYGEAATKGSNPLLFPPAWVDDNYMVQPRGASYYEARGNGPLFKIAWQQ